MSKFAIKFLTQLAEELQQERMTLVDEISYRHRRMMDAGALEQALEVTSSRREGILKALGEIEDATTRGARDSGGLPKTKSTPKTKKAPNAKKTDKADETEQIMKVATNLLSP